MAEVAALGLKVDGVGNINAATSSLNKLSGAAGGAERSAGGLTSESRNTRKSLADVAKAGDKSSTSMTKLAGAAKLAAGAFGVLSAAAAVRQTIRTYAEFESSMARVRAVSRATDKQFALLTKTARDLGATTAFTAAQAASGLEFLARAGWSANESIAAMPAVLDLAAAASMDLGRAADVTGIGRINTPSSSKSTIKNRLLAIATLLSAH